MFAKIATFAAGVCAMSPDAAPLQIMDAMFLSEPKTSSQMLSSSWDSVPCQYIYNGGWYSLVNMDSLTTTYYESATGSKDGIAYWNFCQSLSSTDAPCNGDYYAATNTNSKCVADSTSELSSISSSTYDYTDSDGADQTTLAILYENGSDNCLLVGLICDENENGYTNSELVQNTLSNTQCQW
jgi:hypothetical protein